MGIIMLFDRRGPAAEYLLKIAIYGFTVLGGTILTDLRLADLRHPTS